MCYCLLSISSWYPMCTSKLTCLKPSLCIIFPLKKVLLLYSLFSEWITMCLAVQAREMCIILTAPSHLLTIIWFICRSFLSIIPFYLKYICMWIYVCIHTHTHTHICMYISSTVLHSHYLCPLPGHHHLSTGFLAGSPLLLCSVCCPILSCS